MPVLHLLVVSGQAGVIYGSKDDIAGFAIGAACTNACGCCTPKIPTPTQSPSPTLEDDSSSWKFIVMADWRGAEGYAANPGPNSKHYKNKHHCYLTCMLTMEAI